MRRLKYTMMAIVTALGCAAVVSARPGGPLPAGSQAVQIRIGFTFVGDFEKKAPKPNSTIFFAYYDLVKSEWEKSSRQTDGGGKCSFLVPRGDAGESYPFLYATAQDELDKATKDASEGARRVWRVPPGEQEDLELLTDGTHLSNTKGTIQMWRIEPQASKADDPIVTVPDAGDQEPQTEPSLLVKGRLVDRNGEPRGGGSLMLKPVDSSGRAYISFDEGQLKNPSATSDAGGFFEIKVTWEFLGDERHLAIEYRSGSGPMYLTDDQGDPLIVEIHDDTEVIDLGEVVLLQW